MISRTKEMLTGGKDVINYAMVIKKYPWLVQKDQNCVLGPDSDGLLCGLFVSHYLNWKIRGFYDGKILVLKKRFRPKDCVFLDIEVFRKGIRSVGQHMVMFNKDRLPENWGNFDDCFSANNTRGYDAKHNFPQKYPLGTIHLLLGVLGSIKKIEIPTTAICPLLYTDGTFKNLFNYPDNCLSWLKFLQADDTTSSLHPIFFNDHYSICSLMIALSELFGELRSITGGKRGGDKIKFSNGKGELINFNKKRRSFERDTIEQAEKLLRLLARKTRWEYLSDNWTWDNLSHLYLKKGSIKPSQGRYDQLITKNPISLAVTSALGVEYTLDPKDLF
jgi:hypothetical protein